MVGQMAVVLVVILCALILAGTLSPFVGWLEARPLKRVWAMTLVFGVGALLMGLIGLLVFPPLLDQLSHLVGNLPAIQRKFAGMLERSPLDGTDRGDRAQLHRHQGCYKRECEFGDCHSDTYRVFNTNYELTALPGLQISRHEPPETEGSSPLAMEAVQIPGVAQLPDAP